MENGVRSFVSEEFRMATVFLILSHNEIKYKTVKYS